MDQGGDGICNGAVQALRAQVYLIKGALALGILPDLLRSKVAVRLGAGLDGDNGFWKCIFKIFLVQNIKRILQEFCGLADCHGGYLLFVSVGSRGSFPRPPEGGFGWLLSSSRQVSISCSLLLKTKSMAKF